MSTFQSSLFLLFVTTIYHQYCNAQYQPTPILAANLTTSNPSENGANVTILNSYVISITNDQWSLDIPSWMNNGNNDDQQGYHLLINLNESWGFHPTKESTISFTIHSDQSTGGSDKDIVVSFSVGNSQYFSIFFVLDNGYGNAIYPTCGGSLASGNINNIVSTSWQDREDSAFGGSCCTGKRLQPEGSSYYNYYPITIEMRNNPETDRLYINVDNPQIIAGQTCEYNSAFTSNKGMQIFIGGDDVGDAAIYFKQFEVEYSFDLTYSPTFIPTSFPTSFPSNNPTQIPTTSSPSSMLLFVN